MQQEGSFWRHHQSRRGQSPSCSEDVATKLGRPLPKVGTLEQVTDSETPSRHGMQHRARSLGHRSRLARLPCIHENDVSWSPQQPKVGTWTPKRVRRGSSGNREHERAQESKSRQLKALNNSAHDVRQDSDTDSAVSDVEEEDVEILIGGRDETSAWQYVEEHGGWSRVATGPCSTVRLSDIQALPRGRTDELLSFGSLGHMSHGEKCKPCIFHHRSSCRHKTLCVFCHAKHQLKARQPKKRLIGRIGSKTTKSDSQTVVTDDAVLGMHAPPWRLTLMVVLLATLSLLFFDHSLAQRSTP